MTHHTAPCLCAFPYASSPSTPFLVFCRPPLQEPAQSLSCGKVWGLLALQPLEGLLSVPSPPILLHSHAIAWVETVWLHLCLPHQTVHSRWGVFSLLVLSQDPRHSSPQGRFCEWMSNRRRTREVKGPQRQFWWGREKEAQDSRGSSESEDNGQRSLPPFQTFLIWNRGCDVRQTEQEPSWWPGQGWAQLFTLSICFLGQGWAGGWGSTWRHRPGSQPALDSNPSSATYHRWPQAFFWASASSSVKCSW